MVPNAPKVVRLAEFVGRVLPTLRKILPDRVRVEWHPQPDVSEALTRADEDQLTQVLLHLFANARDAIGDRDGTIAVLLERQRLPLGLAVSRLDDSYLALSVVDDGAGMSADTLTRAFEPFYSGNQGQGLGLSVVRGIIMGHAGYVDAHSSPHQGSRFTLYLPEREASAAKADLGPGGPLVLLAEDEPGVRKIVSRILKHAGYRVVAAATGTEAVELMEQYQNEVAVVMLDAVMPGLAGEDVYRRVQELRPELPVVLSSGYSRSSWPPALLEHEKVAVLAKPYDPANLLLVLEGLLPERPEALGRR